MTFDNNFTKTIEAQTELVLSSSHFSRSVILTRFLRFVVRLSLEGKSRELKEYRLGVEVFERGHSFDHESTRLFVCRLPSSVPSWPSTTRPKGVRMPV